MSGNRERVAAGSGCGSRTALWGNGGWFDDPGAVGIDGRLGLWSAGLLVVVTVHLERAVGLKAGSFLQVELEAMCEVIPSLDKVPACAQRSIVPVLLYMCVLRQMTRNTRIN